MSHFLQKHYSAICFLPAANLSQASYKWQFIFPPFFSWFFLSAEFGKTLPVSKRFSIKGTHSLLLLTKKTQCLLQVKIGSLQPALHSSKVSCTRMFAAKATLTTCTRNPLPCKVESLASIFTKSRLGFLHQFPLCKVQHMPPSPMARASKVKTKGFAPGSSSHNSALARIIGQLKVSFLLACGKFVKSR